MMFSAAMEASIIQPYIFRNQETGVLEGVFPMSEQITRMTGMAAEFKLNRSTL